MKHGDRMKKKPERLSNDEAHITRAVRVLDSRRRVTLELLRGESNWLRSNTVTLYEELADPRMLEHADAVPLVEHAARLSRYVEQLKGQNDAMERLHNLAESHGVWNEWPSEIEVVAVFKQGKR